MSLVYLCKLASFTKRLEASNKLTRKTCERNYLKLFFKVAVPKNL